MKGRKWKGEGKRNEGIEREGENYGGIEGGNGKKTRGIEADVKIERPERGDGQGRKEEGIG